MEVNSPTTVPTPEQKEAFALEFPEALQPFIREHFKLLFVDSNGLHFVPPADRATMTANKEHFVARSILAKVEKVFGIAKIVPVKVEEEQALFLEKALALVKAKEINFSIA